MHYFIFIFCYWTYILYFLNIYYNYNFNLKASYSFTILFYIYQFYIKDTKQHFINFSSTKLFRLFLAFSLSIFPIIDIIFYSKQKINNNSIYTLFILLIFYLLLLNYFNLSIYNLYLDSFLDTQSIDYFIKSRFYNYTIFYIILLFFIYTTYKFFYKIYNKYQTNKDK